MMQPLRARVLAEAAGTLLLVVAVVGSGIMAQRLTAPPHEAPALALLANTLATGGALVALILAFRHVSGAHFNPCVTLTDALSGRLPWREAFVLVLTQVVSGICGTYVTHLQFGIDVFGATGTHRLSSGTFLGEVLATTGLILIIRKVGALGTGATAVAVAGWVVGGYWFTSSTAFANPAVTIARSLTSSYTGIHMNDVPGFIGAQVFGAGLAVLLDRLPQTKP